jgi:3-oxoacyl-[acyl-carrier-protein] synthase II
VFDTQFHSLISGNLSNSLGITGSTDTKVSPLGSLDAVCSGISRISSGINDSILIIGTQESLSSYYYYRLNNLGLLNTKDNGNPLESIRSFDVNAKGLVLGQGAAAVVLENMDSAINRKAKVLAEVKAFSRNNDGKYLLKPDENGEGLAYAIISAMEKADCKVDAVIADGASLPNWDFVELQAIADCIKKPSVTALKANVGHLMGALGCTQFGAGVKAIANVTVT